MEYNCTFDEYMYSKSHYFALEFHRMFGGQIFVWMSDIMDNNNKNYILKTLLKHTFVELFFDYFVDMDGIKKDIINRNDGFNYYEMNYRYGDKDFIKWFIKQYTGQSCTNIIDKKNVREYLRNNMLAFQINVDGKLKDVGLYDANDEYIYLVDYNKSDDTFNKQIIMYQRDVMPHMFVQQYGFRPNKNWYYKKKRKERIEKKEEAPQT